MKKLFLGLMMICSLVGCSAEPEKSTVEEPPVEEAVVEESEPAVDGLAFLDGFAEYGYTAEQIEAMREILTNVGVTEITNLDPGVVTYGMQSVTGVAYKDTTTLDEVQVRFNIENGEIFFVHIYCPSYYHENSTPYLSGLEDRRAELYYNTEGGYLKKIDWENRTVVDWEA